MTLNVDGSIKAETRYGAWGNTSHSSGVIPTDRKYTGQIEESSINLMWYGSRWYDPALGRFISPDSIVPGVGEGGNPISVGHVRQGNFSPLVVDYHELQFLEQQNWENRHRLDDPNIRLSGVPTNPLAFDRYAYVFNNSIRYNDPSGHCIWDMCLVETTIVVGIVVIATAAVIEATAPGKPEAFAQGVDNLGDQLASSIRSFDENARINYALLTAAAEAVVAISQKDLLPRSGDFPYNPPKQKGNPPVIPVRGGGFKDANGNIWKRDKSRHGGDHWDVTHPDGSHTNVNDDGSVRP
ncbi:hypothetical protein FDZ73_24410 [bacterium]|nr:MAG: hypothetical protein FDZ73_24410 [bacterium]